MTLLLLTTLIVHNGKFRRVSKMDTGVWVSCRGPCSCDALYTSSFTWRWRSLCSDSDLHYGLLQYHHSYICSVLFQVWVVFFSLWFWTCFWLTLCLWCITRYKFWSEHTPCNFLAAGNHSINILYKVLILYHWAKPHPHQLQRFHISPALDWERAGGKFPIWRCSRAVQRYHQC